jgi:hypothetical protein
MKKIGIVAILIGVVLVIVSFFTPTYDNIQFTAVDVKMKSFKNTDIRGEQVFALDLEGCKADFEIEQNYYSFNKELFEKSVKRGDSLRLLLPKGYLDKEGEVVDVFEVSKNKTVFLKREDSISDFKMAYKVVLYSGIGFFIIGTLILLLSAIQGRQNN